MKNWSTYSYLITLLCLGFFLIPNSSYACAKETTETAQESYSKAHSAKSKEIDRCQTKSSKKANDCNDDCKYSSCRCGTSSSLWSLENPFDLKADNPFSEIKKQRFVFKNTYCSSGYSSIWQPPKID